MNGGRTLSAALLVIGATQLALGLSFAVRAIEHGRDSWTRMSIWVSVVLGASIMAAAIVGLRRRSGPDLRLLFGAVLVALLGGAFT